MVKKPKRDDADDNFSASRGRPRTGLQVENRIVRANAQIAQASALEAIESDHGRWLGWAADEDINLPEVQAQIDDFLEEGYSHRERDYLRQQKLGQQRQDINLQTFKSQTRYNTMVLVLKAYFDLDSLDDFDHEYYKSR